MDNGPGAGDTREVAIRGGAPEELVDLVLKEFQKFDERFDKLGDELVRLTGPITPGPGEKLILGTKLGVGARWLIGSMATTISALAAAGILVSGWLVGDVKARMDEYQDFMDRGGRATAEDLAENSDCQAHIAAVVALSVAGSPVDDATLQKVEECKRLASDQARDLRRR